MDIATLKTRLNGAFLWLGLLSLAMGVAFLFLIGRVDDKFAKSDEKIGHVSDQLGDLRVLVAAQTTETKNIGETLSRIENANNAETSSRDGKNGSVHTGAPAKP